MEKGKKFLSDLKLYSDYLKWDNGSYETWEDACEDIINGHKNHYSHIKNINTELDFALKLMKEKTVLASQRSLQYRNEQIEKHNTRMYNCSSMYAARNKIFQEVFYLCLSGCGVGIGLLIPFVKNISKIQKRNSGTKTYIIEDSIEGWADALGVLMSSYFVDKQSFPEYSGFKVKFDYSNIRSKGSFISGGFKAPGFDGLKQSLEKIESLIDNWYVNEGPELRPIIVADIICHSVDAVLSGGVRRAAINFIVDSNDDEMIYAKTGNWFNENPQRGRTNNSVLLLRSETSKEEFEKLIKLNNGQSDIGFVFANSYLDMMNPCYEILMMPILTSDNFQEIKYEDVENYIKENQHLLGVQLCNLSEINADNCTTKERFLDACKAATILGTVQAGYTSFSYLGEITEKIVKKEALIGVSITGWMNNPMLFDESLLKEGVSIVKSTNRKIASILNINPAARTTTVKPSGNASVILGTASGIHPEHSERYFRIMQLNKESETAKWLEKNMPFLIEDSLWSSTNSDYVVYVPIQNPKEGLYKKDVKGVKHLELIKLVQKYWVSEGTNKELCTYPNVNHNVSCSVIVDDQQAVTDYIWDNNTEFTAVSFISDFGDKDFIQAPFTAVSNFEDLVNDYGHGVIFASGLVVDGLHYYNNNLWQACKTASDKSIPLSGTKEDVLLKKYWLSRVKKFANNFFNGNVQKAIYCLKDVHLYHKWVLVNRQFHDVDFSKILNEPKYNNVNKFAAMSCSGGSCEITRI